jgi:hypothetical protein
MKLIYLLGFYDGIILVGIYPGFEKLIYWKLPFGELRKALDQFYSGL